VEGTDESSGGGPESNSLVKAGEPLLVIKDVGKDYVSGAGIVRALRTINFVVNQGEFVAIVGTSGSGKSTLMNILGCLDRPTRGTYTLAGVDVGGRTADGRAIVRNRVIGFIFQGFNLLSRTTALENVELPLSYRGVSAKERRTRAERALASVGLAARTDHTPNQLSGGQQQRVAIARALVTDPPLLLADEPTGNLDTRTSLEVLALLQKLNVERGITIVLVTHEPDIAQCAGRMITFRDGNIVEDRRVENRKDAAHELALLPPPEVYATAGAGSGDAALAALIAARKPIPFGVTWRLLLGTVLGALLGFLYGKFIVGKPVPGIGPGLGFLLEARFVAGYFQGEWGHQPAWRQSLKVAFWYSLATLVFIGLAVVISPPEPVATFLAKGGSAAVTFAAGSLGALALLTAVRFGVARLAAALHPKPKG